MIIVNRNDFLKNYEFYKKGLIFYKNELIYEFNKKDTYDNYKYYCYRVKTNIIYKERAMEIIKEEENRLKNVKENKVQKMPFIKEIITKINTCKNKLWKLEYNYYEEYVVYKIIFGGFYKLSGHYDYISEENFKDVIFSKMKYLYYKKNGMETVERIFLKGDCK